MQVIPHTIRITNNNKAGIPSAIKDVEQLNNFVHCITQSKLGKQFFK